MQPLSLRHRPSTRCQGALPTRVGSSVSWRCVVGSGAVCCVSNLSAGRPALATRIQSRSGALLQGTTWFSIAWYERRAQRMENQVIVTRRYLVPD